MYSKDSILKEQKKLLAIINTHFERLSNCQFTSHLAPQAIAMVFGPKATIKIPVLDEIWRKILRFCEKNRKAGFLYCSVAKNLLPSGSFVLTVKRSMNNNYNEIIKNLVTLSQQIVARVSAERIDLLDQDESYFSSFFKDNNLTSLREMSSRVALKQLKNNVPLTPEELSTLLFIAIQLAEKGIATDFYLQHHSSPGDVSLAINSMYELRV